MRRGRLRHWGAAAAGALAWRAWRRSAPPPGPAPGAPAVGAEVPRPDDERASSWTETPGGRSEVLVAALLILSALAALGFIAVYVVSGDTQGLGLTLGGALALLAAAAVVAGKRVVPQVRATEPRRGPSPPEVAEEVEEDVRDGGTGITRTRLLVGSAAGAGIALGGALVVPAASLGPGAWRDDLGESLWAAGRRVVDAEGRPVRADDVLERTFVTGYPEGQPRRRIGAPIVIVRLSPDQLELPPARSAWAPEGLLAFSKICPHAGCAIALYRAPLYRPTSPPPALVCPCHYSTFDIARGGEVIYGPAGRALPQLPLRIGPGGVLEAAGDFAGDLGPAWSGLDRGET